MLPIQLTQKAQENAMWAFSFAQSIAIWPALKTAYNFKSYEPFSGFYKADNGEVYTHFIEEN